MSRPRRGEVWFADLGEPRGLEQALRRPVVILQADDLSNLRTVVVIPLTSNPKRAGQATNVMVSVGEAGLTEQSYALCHHIQVLDRSKLLHKMGDLPLNRLSEIETVVRFVLGLPG